MKKDLGAQKPPAAMVIIYSLDPNTRALKKGMLYKSDFYA